MNDIIDPEVLPPGGPAPRKVVSGEQPRPPMDWTGVVGAGLGLDMLGFFAKGFPLKLVTAFAGAGLAVWLMPRLRIPLRFAGWMAAAGALYAGWTKLKFLPVAVTLAVLRAWSVRRP